MLARYTHGLGVDKPLAMLRTGLTSYYEADGLGSITSLTDAAGAVAASYAYDSFGNLTASSGTVVSPFRYTAREFDSETGLYYYRARYYWSAIGRFLNEDSSRFATGTPNFYPYVESSPVNHSDPSGHLKKDADLGCCNARNIDIGIRELERVLNNPQITGGQYYRKYQKCLKEQAFPQETVKCAENLSGCGDFNPLTPDSIQITPLGSRGRKGACGPVAATLVHELVHNCYFRHLEWADLNRLEQEKEAYGVECELFGTGCGCARNPRLCTGR